MSTLRQTSARALAQAFLAGEWHLRGLMARGDFALSAGGLWLREVAFDVMQRWPTPPLHALELVARFVDAHESFDTVWRERKLPRTMPHFLPFEPQMGPMRWPVPQLPTHHELARWLGVSDEEAEWFCDRKALERHAPTEALRHYRRRWIARGERQPRLLEAPKQRLKALQRRVLDEVLSKIPVHQAAHGFVPGRSALTHARLHVGKAWVVRFDLEAFFTHVSVAKALGVFLSAGFPWGVSRSLLGLCTTRTPETVLREAPRVDTSPEELGRRFFLQRRLASWHLPQGAPTSPALANLTSFALDARLDGFARTRDLTYSRYADDLVFSGDDPLNVGALTNFVNEVTRAEGFRVNVSKTRVMHAHRRQEVTGVVVNTKPNIGRHEFDLLKAQLHRCLQHGLDSEADPRALQARLRGQIEWVAQLSSARGAKLRRAFDAIAWPTT